MSASPRPEPLGQAPQSGPDFTEPSSVILEAVSFSYPQTATPALLELSYSQRRGEMVGIMGASGAGKSTFAKCLNGVIPGFEEGVFSGTVTICGRRLEQVRVSAMAATVGLVFQDFEAQLFSTNVEHEVAFAMEQLGFAPEEIRRRIGPALHAVGLNGFEGRDPTTLSGGEKQRLAIASVLALEPQVVVLDEPTTDLDPEGRAEVFGLISRLRERGLSLIVIEHESEEMRQCDRIVVLREGQIAAQGPPSEILGQLALLRRCGIRPPAVNHVLEQLGIEARATGVDQAEEIIRQHLPLPPQGQSPAPPPKPPTHTGASALAEPALIEIRNVSYGYSRAVKALDGVSLSIGPGEFVAIIGQNGSGKTTLAKHAVGLLSPGQGQVLIAGKPRQAMSWQESALLVGYVFQNPDHQIFAATVEDEIAFGPTNLGLAGEEIARRTERVLEAVELAAMRGSDPFLLGRGERQRLAVASILALEPRLLILDEPTTGLDHPQQLKMMELITELNRQGIAIVIISHTPWLVAEYARRAVLMRHGRKVFDGPVRELLADDSLLASASFRVPEVVALSRRFGLLCTSPGELATSLRAMGTN